MIVRGLQLIVLVVLLGAAPLNAQPVFPYAVTLQDFADSSLNGLYVNVGTTGETGATVFQRYSVSSNSPQFYATIAAYISGGNWYSYVSIHDSYPDVPTAVSTSRLAISQIKPFSGSELPSPWLFSGGALGSGSAIATPEPPPVDPYVEAFPDWESAVTTIPLGFAFAMAFWASATAITIGMKWAKELASAAT